MRNIYILLALALTACKSTTSTDENNGPVHYNATTSNEHLKKISVPVTADRLKLSAVTDGYQVVRPDSKSDHMFGEIKQLNVTSDKYIIYDDISSAVMIFDKAGKFISKIKAGTIDSVNLQSIDAIDTYKDKIYIKSASSNNLSVFNTDGQLLNQNKLRFFYSNFMILNDKEDVLMNTDKMINYMYAGDTMVADCANMYILTQSAQQPLASQSGLLNTPKLRRYFPFSVNKFPNGSLHFYVNNPFSRAGDEVYYNLVFSDTIYTVASPEVVKPKYTIDFGDRKSTFNLLQKTGEEIASYLKKLPEEACMVSNFFETPSFIHFGYAYHGQYNTAIYSKKSGKTITGHLENDIFGQELMFIAADGDEFIATVKPYKMKELVAKSSAATTDANALQQLVKMTKDMSDNDNEMIVRCKFKAF